VTTVSELTVAEEIVAVRESARARGWTLEEPDPLHFLLGLPASDGSRFYLFVDCINYPAVPPAWHWCDALGVNRDQPRHSPGGSGFLHSAGVICAPWNRLAYKVIDPRGPHAEWTLADWRNNSYTQGCKTLGAMVLRVYVELNGSNFAKKRLAA
jgi:hypothetical protein